MDPDSQEANSITKETLKPNLRYYRLYDRGFKITNSKDKKSTHSVSFSSEVAVKKSTSLILKPSSILKKSFDQGKCNTETALTPEKNLSQTQQKFVYLKTEPNHSIRPTTSQHVMPFRRTTSDYNKISADLNNEMDLSNLNAQMSNMSEIYLINKKKYLPRVHSFNLMGSSKKVRNQMENASDIRKIKEDVKFARDVKRQPKQSLIRTQKLKSLQELNNVIETSPADKAAQTKIAILRKKIAISQMFGAEEIGPKNERPKELTAENRKKIFKRLLLEYHPDKNKHPREVACEISNYLFSNKQLFVEGTATI